MYLCMDVCLCVHVSGREEWKEFPALFCVGVKILEGAGCWLSWCDCQSSEEETHQVFNNIHIPYV